MCFTHFLFSVHVAFVLALNDRFVFAHFLIWRVWQFFFSFACMFFVRVCEHISISPLCGSFLVSLHFVFEAQCFFSFIRFPLFFPSASSACSFVFPSLVSNSEACVYQPSGHVVCAHFVTTCFLPVSTECFCSSLSRFFVASFVDEEELLRRNRRMRIIVVWVYFHRDHAYCVFSPSPVDFAGVPLCDVVSFLHK